MFDFPASPADGTIYAPPTGPQYQYSGGAWRVASSSVPIATAEARNRIGNPAFQISQENGNTASGANAYFMADQWSAQYNGIGQMGAGRQPNVVPTSGSPLPLLINVQSTNASLASNAYVRFDHYIEGLKIADLKWGTAGAIPVVVRFTFAAPIGTYSLAIRNPSGAMCYIVPIPVTVANTFVTYTFAIPGPTSGTWAIDNTSGVQFMIIPAAGSGYLGAPNVWTGGNLLGHTGMSNGAAVNGNSFWLADVGFYADPRGTGVPPPWQYPDYAEDLTACQRYYQRVSLEFCGNTSATASYYALATYPVPPRANPTLSGINTNNPGFPAAVGTLTNVGNGVQEGRVTTGGTSALFSSYITANARL
jgi:hypothetical protein